MTGFSKLIGEGKLRAYKSGEAVRLYHNDTSHTLATFVNEDAFRMIIGHDVADFNRKMEKNAGLAERHQRAREES